MFTIKTNRLILRQWQESDLEPFAALNADSTVMEFFPSLLTREQSDELVKRCSEQISTHGWGFWAATLIETGEFIGFLGLHPVTFEAPFTPAVEIGWRLAYKHWGKGYATEGANAALAYGLDKLKLPQIVSFTTVNNLRSRHVMEKIGMDHTPADDFDHPKLPPGHPLRRHVLYRYRVTTLQTPRLIVRTFLPGDDRRLAKFETRNSDHFSLWKSTSTGPSQNSSSDQSVRFFLFLKEGSEGDIIGTCTFSQIFLGAFHACYLGYRIDAAHEGKGLMSEALEKAIAHMFQEENIHRIMANYMPANTRSARLLESLGFKIEGRAENYLLINGKWEDHVLTSLTNPRWRYV